MARFPLPSFVVCMLLVLGAVNASKYNAAGPEAAAGLPAEQQLTEPAAAAAYAWLAVDTDLAMTTAEAKDLALAIDKPIIVAIGDSITQFGNNEGGWVVKMAAAYGSSVDVLNKGVVMGNTRKGKVLAQAVARSKANGGIAHRVKLATICFGANDASVNPRNETYRAVPLVEYSANLAAMVETLMNGGISNILLITPPPATRIGSRLAVTAEYAEAMKAVGRTYKLPVADLFSAIQEVPDWPTKTLLPDKLHLSVGGNAVMYDTVMATIDKDLPAVSPRALRESAGLVGF